MVLRCGNFMWLDWESRFRRQGTQR
ncbi:MAG: hypothetical protein JWN70_6647, partial [Planctomycetaceae bacterium]|nr:hypothetical protein [Planctomycetaceae bacterium]